MERREDAICFFDKPIMRLGEIIGLRWQDIIGNEVLIRQTLQRAVEKGFVTGPPKTAAGKRKIPVSAGTIAALEKHRKWWPESRLAHPTNEDDLLHSACLRYDITGQPAGRKIKTPWPTQYRVFWV